MTVVRFKFRSSPAVEAVDLAGRSSISVRDLRARILERATLPPSQNFDLIISATLSGDPFEDQEFQIPAGSSVIVKRVPAGRSKHPDPVLEDSAGKQGGFVGTAVPFPLKNGGTENFHDFGKEFHPSLEQSFPEIDADLPIVNSNGNEKDDVVPRCSGPSISRYQDSEVSDASDATSKEIVRDNCCNEHDIEEDRKHTKPKPKMQDQKLYERVGMCSSMLNIDLPAELRCSICSRIFEDAVMIPCCQHSFCDKCIRLALIERGKCPKCSSIKCTNADLLPNLSLRQAIEHFLEKQVADNYLENIFPKYAPDGESGIQAKEASCNVSIQQQEPQFPHSPSTYENENKQTAGITIRLDGDKSVKTAPLSLLKANQIQCSDKSSAEAFKKTVDCGGSGNSSKLLENLLQNEEADVAMQKMKVLGVSAPDGSGNLMPPKKHRKGGRACYMCGSLNHLIRDCPAASNSCSGDATFLGGMSAYGQPYWRGASFPQVRPYGNIYGASGMMPFDPTIVPTAPFGLPSYMPSVYDGMQMPYGFMRMGGMPPSMMAGAERPLTHAEFLDLQAEQKHKYFNEQPERERDCDDMSKIYHYPETRRPCERKHQLNKEAIGISSDNGSQKMRKNHPHDGRHSPPYERPGFVSDEEIYAAHGKHEKGSHPSTSGRDQRAHYSEKSDSEGQALSSNSYRHRKERKKHHHRSSKGHCKRKGQCESGGIRKSHQKEIVNDREKVVKDHRSHSHRHHNHSDSGLELDYSCDRKRLRKDKESSHRRRHSSQMVNSTDDYLEDDRWPMVDGLDEDYREDYYYQKRKRT